jgi:hypothetical protein
MLIEGEEALQYINPLGRTSNAFSSFYGFHNPRLFCLLDIPSCY